jgi:trehalose 6-phosphate phosphatase
MSLRSTVNPIEVEQFVEAVARSPVSTLLLDYDGTLAPFCLDRQHAFTYPGITSLLQEIVDNGRTRVVIITGRNAHEVGPLLALHPTPEVWGCHGLERLKPDGTYDAPCVDQSVLHALAEADGWLKSQGLHHRAEFKTLLEFDGGIEMRKPGHDKGDAVRTILDEVGPEVPVAYLGDDLTDERAFHALGSRGLSVLVRPQWRKTAAAVWIKPPDALREFLTRWLAACREQQYCAGAASSERK